VASGAMAGIYVETRIRVPLEELWAHTQRPELHERWDLRFSRIEYLPKLHGSDPQRFRYATRIGFGLEVAGEGESVGESTRADGSRSSALKFSSQDPRSIIRDGSGYWQYIPTSDGIRFLTWYDYRTRFGVPGRVFDRVVFRPLIGWATAWSFDRLRLWLEGNLDPAQTVRQSIAHAVARVAVALIFAYHGLVPKLLGPHADEVAMFRDAGVEPAWIGTVLTAVGLGELLFAVCLLRFWRSAWPPLVTLGFMAAATIGVSLTSPRYLGAAFNPVSLNLAIAALAAIDLLTRDGLPSASRCLRRAPESNP
jgi:uncharacterized membrane protein YphA (DoxX/SURF4 family)